MDISEIKNYIRVTEGDTYRGYEIKKIWTEKRHGVVYHYVLGRKGTNEVTGNSDDFALAVIDFKAKININEDVSIGVDNQKT